MRQQNVTRAKVDPHAAALTIDDLIAAHRQATAVLFDAPSRVFIGEDRWKRITADMDNFKRLAFDYTPITGTRRFCALDVVIDYDDRERLEFK